MFSSVAYSNDVETWKKWKQNKTSNWKNRKQNKWVKKRNVKKVEKKWEKMDLSICIFLHLFCFFDLLFRFVFFVLFCLFFCFFPKINAKKCKSKKQNKWKKMQMDKYIVSPCFPLCFPFFPLFDFPFFLFSSPFILLLCFFGFCWFAFCFFHFFGICLGFFKFVDS